MRPRASGRCPRPPPKPRREAPALREGASEGGGRAARRPLHVRPAPRPSPTAAASRRNRHQRPGRQSPRCPSRRARSPTSPAGAPPAPTCLPAAATESPLRPRRVPLSGWREGRSAVPPAGRAPCEEERGSPAAPPPPPRGGDGGRRRAGGSALTRRALPPSSEPPRPRRCRSRRTRGSAPWGLRRGRSLPRPAGRVPAQPRCRWPLFAHLPRPQRGRPGLATPWGESRGGAGGGPGLSWAHLRPPGREHRTLLWGCFS